MAAEEGYTDDVDVGYIELRIAPSQVGVANIGTVEGGAKESNGAGAAAHEIDAVMAMFQAVSACQDLNPDEDSEGEGAGMDEGGDGGFDETAPGASGWITAENMADFMDADGNLVMPGGGGPLPVIGGEVDGAAESLGELGEGAERRRAAEYDAVDGDDAAKWQRTG